MSRHRAKPPLNKRLVIARVVSCGAVDEDPTLAEIHGETGGLAAQEDRLGSRRRQGNARSCAFWFHFGGISFYQFQE